MSQYFDNVPGEQQPIKPPQSPEMTTTDSEAKSAPKSEAGASQGQSLMKRAKFLWNNLDKLVYFFLLIYIAVFLINSFGSHHALTPLPLPHNIPPNHQKNIQEAGNIDRADAKPEHKDPHARNDHLKTHPSSHDLKTVETETYAVSTKTVSGVKSAAIKQSEGSSKNDQGETATSVQKDEGYQQFMTKIRMAPYAYLKKVEGSRSSIKTRLQSSETLGEGTIGVMSNEERKELVIRYLRRHKSQESMWLSELLGKDFADEDLKNRIAGWKEKQTYAEVEQEQKFCIVVNSHNNARHRQIERTLSSIMRQSYSDYQVILVDRGSTDNTLDIVQQALKKYPKLDSKVTVVKSEAIPYLKGTHMGLAKCDIQSIAVLMDGNSELLGQNVLSMLQEQYLNNKVKTVYTGSASLDYATSAIKQQRVQSYDESENFMLNYRFSPRKFASLLTFRMRVMNRVKEGHLSKNGLWYGHTKNDALAFAVLEATCGKTGVIKKPLLLQQVDSDVDSQNSREIKLEKVRLQEQAKIDIC